MQVTKSEKKTVLAWSLAFWSAPQMAQSLDKTLANILMPCAHETRTVIVIYLSQSLI